MIFKTLYKKQKIKSIPRRSLQISKTPDENKLLRRKKNLSQNMNLKLFENSDYMPLERVYGQDLLSMSRSSEREKVSQESRVETLQISNKNTKLKNQSISPDSQQKSKSGVSCLKFSYNLLFNKLYQIQNISKKITLKDFKKSFEILMESLKSKEILSIETQQISKSFFFNKFIIQKKMEFNESICDYLNLDISTKIDRILRNCL